MSVERFTLLKGKEMLEDLVAPLLRPMHLTISYARWSELHYVVKRMFEAIKESLPAYIWFNKPPTLRPFYGPIDDLKSLLVLAETRLKGLKFYPDDIYLVLEAPVGERYASMEYRFQRIYSIAALQLLAQPQVRQAILDEDYRVETKNPGPISNYIQTLAALLELVDQKPLHRVPPLFSENRENEAHLTYIVNTTSTKVPLIEIYVEKKWRDYYLYIEAMTTFTSKPIMYEITPYMTREARKLRLLTSSLRLAEQLAAKLEAQATLNMQKVSMVMKHAD